VSVLGQVLWEGFGVMMRVGCWDGDGDMDQIYADNDRM
jgi:hypothetical protein